MGDLPSSEHERHLHLVSFAQEAPSVARLGIEVVLIDAGTELHFLELDHVLLLAGDSCLLGLLELELAEVHDAHHNRSRQWSYFDEIESGFIGERQGSLYLHDAKLGTIGAYDSHRTDANLPIHANAWLLFCRLLLNRRLLSCEGKNDCQSKFQLMRGEVTPRQVAKLERA